MVGFISKHCVFILPPGSLVFPLFGRIGVHNVGSQTVQVARKGQMFSEIHLVAEWGGVLGLDTRVAQQRFENNLETRKII